MSDRKKKRVAQRERTITVSDATMRNHLHSLFATRQLLCDDNHSAPAREAIRRVILSLRRASVRRASRKAGNR